MGWIQYGEIDEDAGDVGGDDQVGRAKSVRFHNPDLSGRLVIVTVYPAAREWSATDQPDPECTHSRVLLETLEDGIGRFAPMPSEHLRCLHDMDSVGLRMEVDFTICGDIDSPGDTEEWSVPEFDDLDTRPYTGSVEEILKKAETDAFWAVKTFDPKRNIHWDGTRF